MAIMITDECINCGACEPECPNTAIYEGGVQWTWGDGTSLTKVEIDGGEVVDGKAPQPPISPEPRVGAYGQYRSAPLKHLASQRSY